jgi:hypothetical protein
MIRENAGEATTRTNSIGYIFSGILMGEKCLRELQDSASQCLRPREAVHDPVASTF